LEYDDSSGNMTHRVTPSQHETRKLVIMRKFLILLTAAGALATAQNDPPGRAARLSYSAGAVSFQPAGEEKDWAPADVNRALTTGDKLWVETGGRTEIQTINSVIRLNGHTNFQFLTVDDSTTQIQLSLGVLLVRVSGLGDQETYEIDTPQVAFTILRPGIYRVEVNEAGDTSVITVRGGDGETTADGKAAPVHVNEQVVIRGGAYDKHGAPRTDEFDAWAAERDARMASSISVQRVAPGMVGVTDLDVYGVWRPHPVYGNVWFPNGLVAGWAPYRFGHWGFVAPWGWTWIDDSPWGYAPFHYGRWVMVGGVWAWAPGPVAYTAIYSPALVSFISGVEVVGVVDPVSWVALSWGEPWYPGFAVSWGYYNSVNLCGTIFAPGIIAGVWGGASVSLAFGHNPAAVNVVGRGGFEGGHAVGREFVHGDRFGGHAFDHAGAFRGGARGFNASREARFGGHAPLREGSRGFPPRNAMGRSAVTRHEPGAKSGNFRGAGVAAKHGPSANGGRSGSFRPASNPGGAAKGGAPAGGAKAGPPAGGAKGSSPAGGAKGSSPAPRGGTPSGGARSGTPSGGSKGGTPSGASRGGTPSGGARGPATGASRGGAPAGGSRGGATPQYKSAPNTGGARGPAAGGGASRGGSPVGGAAQHSNAAPARGGAPKGPAPAASHPSAPAPPRKK
jgi:hypothetical protein